MRTECVSSVKERSMATRESRNFRSLATLSSSTGRTSWLLCISSSPA